MWSAALVAGGWLAGCASGTPDKVKAETKQQTPIPSLEEFTTVGKPTRTIDTPMGPREVYDPAQDLEIQKAFNKFYKDSNERSYFLQASSGYFGEPYLFDFEPKLPDELRDSFALLTLARHVQRQSLAKTQSCKFIIDSACNTGWKVLPCEGDDCVPKLSFMANIFRTGCTIENKLIYSISYHPIGKHFEAIPDEEEQLENFFAIECK